MRTEVVELNFKPRVWQQVILSDKSRHKAVLAHRTAGKTYLATAMLLIGAVTDAGDYAFIAPEKGQGIRAMWDHLVQIIEPLLKLMPNIKINNALSFIKIPPLKAGGRWTTIHVLAAEGNLKGLHCKGIVIDETADITKEIYDDAISPIIVSHQGWSLNIGTYQEGDNLLNNLMDFGKDPDFTNWSSYKVDIFESGVYTPDEIAEIEKTQSPQGWAQNYLMISSTNQGAIYAPMLKKIKENNQIGLFPYDKRLPVYTGWDLAYFPDYTCIWFAQIDPSTNKIFLIDFLKHRQEEADYYARELLKKPYLYGTAFLPHDATQNSGKKITYEKELNKIGIRCQILPRTADKEKAVYPIQQAIHRCFFNQLLTDEGIKELQKFSMKKTKSGFQNTIDHNDTADAFRCLLEGLLGKIDFEFNSRIFKQKMLNLTEKKLTPLQLGRKRLGSSRR